MIWYCLWPSCQTIWTAYTTPDRCPTCGTKREHHVRDRVVQMLTSDEAEFVHPTDPYIERLRKAEAEDAISRDRVSC